MHAAIDKIYKKDSTVNKFAENDLQYISNIYKQYCSNQITKSELLEYFPVPDDFKNCIITAIEVRKSQVCQKLLDESRSSEVPLLKTFDWDVKLVTGDSSLASRRETIATLILNCQNGSSEEKFSMELDSELVNKLIHSIEEEIKE